MEDALIAPEGFMILSGAGLVEASEDAPVYQHMMETTDEVVVVTGENADSFANTFGESVAVAAGDVIIYLKSPAYLPNTKRENFAYVMIAEDGAPVTEPVIPVHFGENVSIEPNENGLYPILVKSEIAQYWCPCEDGDSQKYSVEASLMKLFETGAAVLVDYYTEKTSGARQIEISADKFGGNYYLEASTLFRDTNGVDMPAEFIIPNCKIQSNFTFTMASSGDPSELMRLAA